MTDIIVAETMKRLTGLDPYEGTMMYRKKYVNVYKTLEVNVCTMLPQSGGRYINGHCSKYTENVMNIFTEKVLQLRSSEQKSQWLQTSTSLVQADVRRS